MSARGSQRDAGDAGGRADRGPRRGRDDAADAAAANKRPASRKNRIRSLKRLLSRSELPRTMEAQMARELKQLEHRVRARARAPTPLRARGDG